jgi:hypothetical protein
LAADEIESTTDLTFEMGKPFTVDIDLGFEGLGLCRQGPML